MSLTAVRSVAVIAMAALVITAGGCGGDGSPPEPDPQYEQIPRDMCDRLRIGEMAKRWDLTIAAWHEPASDYRTHRTYWRVLCDFIVRAADGRFATEFGDFEPHGQVAVEVYHEEAKAEEQGYDQVARGDFGRREAEHPGSTAPITGWWDEGLSLEWVTEVDPDIHIYGDIDVSDLVVSHLVRHENLVLKVDLHAGSPTEDNAEVLALLHDLAAAMIDEAVEHLTLTG